MIAFTKKKRILSVLALGLLTALPGLAATDDWLDHIARFLGISKTPSQLRAPSGSLEGNIYLATVGGTPMPVTTDGGYRSPVFLPGAVGLLALKGDTVVRWSLSNGTVQPLQTVSHALKLLGVDASDPDQVLALLQTPDGSPELGVLNLKSGQLTPLPHDRDSKAHRRLLSHLRGDDREFKTATVYVKTESKARLGGQVEWTDIYVKRQESEPVNISHCDGVDCGQPALSADGQRVAFIKAEATR